MEIAFFTVVKKEVCLQIGQQLNAVKILRGLGAVELFLFCFVWAHC